MVCSCFYVTATNVALVVAICPYGMTGSNAYIVTVFASGVFTVSIYVETFTNSAASIAICVAIVIVIMFYCTSSATRYAQFVMFV